VTARGSQPTSGFKGDIHRASFGLAHLRLADRSQRCQSVLAQARIHARNANFASERTREVLRSSTPDVGRLRAEWTHRLQGWRVRCYRWRITPLLPLVLYQHPDGAIRRV
jgi:hypothetical protein